MVNSVKNVVITGGTHGNELTGVYLVKHWLENPKIVSRDSYSTELLLSNPKAISEVRRYIDQDLNRQFNVNDLNNAQLQGHEQKRAKSLNHLLGPKENPRVDFIIDLHTTTANMGISLIFNSSDPLVMGMAFYIKQKMPQATLFYNPIDRLQDNYLRSLGRHGGLVIEVGPIAQGLLHYQTYSDTQSAVLHALDYLEKHNIGEALNLPNCMSGYEFIQKVPLPKNSKGDIVAMIHPNLQNQDYQAINPGDPLFITLAGETIVYQGEQTVYGAFINEAAYYDQHIGLSLLDKININLNYS